MTDINEFLLKKLDKFDEKLDRQSEELGNQSKLLSEYNQSLREHMKRTRMLEDKVEPLHIEYTERKVAEKLKMKTWKKVTMVLGAIGTLVALGVGIAQLMGVIK